MNENKILGSNRLPGSEKLTRPEEIKSMSKYLKAIRETYEENTNLDTQLDGIPGKTTGKIPRISELPADYTKTPGKSPGITLSNYIGHLEIPEKNQPDSLHDDVISRLENTRVDINDQRETDLNSEKILLGGINKEIELPTSSVTLNDSRENKLEENFVNLDLSEEEKNIALVAYKELLEKSDTGIVDLSNTKLGLQVSKDISLSDTRIDIDYDPNPSLTDYIDFLQSREDITLGDTRINLEENRNYEISELPEFLLSLENSHENTLDETRINLQDIRENKLDDTRLDLEDTRNPELDNTRIDIDSQENVNLEKTRLDLKNIQDTELDYTRVNLEDTRDTTLDDTRLDLQDTRDTELDNTRIDIDSQENVNLEKTRLDLEDTRNPELDDTRLDLKDIQNPELDDTRLDLKDTRDTELDNTRLDLKDTRDTTLDDTRLDLHDQREFELPEGIIPKPSDKNEETGTEELATKSIKLEGVEDIGRLEETRLDLEDTRKNTLEDFIDSLEDTSENFLEDERLDIEDLRENSLEDERLDLNDLRENTLEDERLDLGYIQDNELGEIRIDIEDSREEKLEDTRLDLVAPDVNLEDDLVSRPINLHGEPEELYNDLLTVSGNVDLDNSLEDTKINLENIELDNNLEDTKIDLGENLNPIQSSKKDEPPTTLEEYIQNLSDQEAYTEALDIAREGKNASPEMANWFSKISSLISAYFSSPQMSPQRAFDYMSKVSENLKKFREDFNPNVNVDSSGQIYHSIPSYQLTKNGSILDALNINEYIRWLAEKTVGGNLPPQVRRLLLDETLAALVLARDQAEKLAKANRDRLPGNDFGLITAAVQGGVSGAIDKAVGNLKKSASQLFSGASGVDHTNPMNRPETDYITGQLKDTGIGITDFERTNDRDSKELKKNKLKGVLKNLVRSTIGGSSGDNYISLSHEYLTSRSFSRTLKDLCPGAEVGERTTLEDLRTILESSPYITTPAKFGTLMKGRYLTQSLDTNTYWEIVMSPFVSPEMNGGWSFLPAIWEINLENIKDHGYPTAYSSWVPINSFELQKSKSTSKQLSLYDGEIFYPVGTEFLNELRITIVDDSFKSWRRYFEKCIKVSVYNSEAHRAPYYAQDPDYSRLTPTAIDESNLCIALYKNITFEFEIYIMNPQYNQIKKYHLLGVLKDFTEESIGEIDSGGTDLNVSFSIVGENPSQTALQVIKSNKKTTGRSNFDALAEQKKKNSSNNNLIKLL